MEKENGRQFLLFSPLQSGLLQWFDPHDEWLN